MTADQTVVIGVNDPFFRRALEDAVMAHPAFRSMAAVSNAVQAADVARHCRVDAVILADESPGLRGRDVLDDLARDLPDARVIISSTGDLVELQRHRNVSAAVPDGDVDAVVHALTALAEWFADPTDFGIDRRAHGDRRVVQDWSKTFAQRRVGGRRDGGEQRTPAASTT